MQKLLFPSAILILIAATGIYWWWPASASPIKPTAIVAVTPTAPAIAKATKPEAPQEQRADIQQWISQQPPHLQPWLTKTAASMAKTMTVTSDSEVKALAPEISKIVQCGYQTVTEADPADKAISVKNWIEAVEGQIGNTPERLAAYQTAQQRFHGVVTFDADPATACT